jgi:uncharacterized membrane protein YqaE (UPF0057 family)
MRKIFFFLLATLLIAPTFNHSSAAVIVPVTTSSEPNPEAVKAALAEFKSLSRKEKKAKLKSLKKELFAQIKAKKEGREADTNTILLVILAVLLPPLAVYLHQGEINTKFWITLILWLLGFLAFTWIAWLPLLASIIYALFVILGNG